MAAFARLPYSAPLDDYAVQADAALTGWKAGDQEAVEFIAGNHPWFFETETPWVRRRISEQEVRAFPLTREGAQLAVARWYEFLGWPELVAWSALASDPKSETAKFEAAVEGLIAGDAVALQNLIAEHPWLVTARSSRVTPHDPNVHGATLLHYLGANGVEGWRQRTPANAVEMAKILLDAGADVEAKAGFYGGQQSTMGLLITSTPPAEAGVQAALAEILLDYGAEGKGAIAGALRFGFRETALALLRRGLPLESMSDAAALGMFDEVARRLPLATAEERHRALALSAQHGQAEVVRLLLDAGEDPNRYNPPGHHQHSTPLHQAVCAGHMNVVRLLIERGANPNMPDTIYQGTAADWAYHCNQPAIETWLRTQS